MSENNAQNCYLPGSRFSNEDFERAVDALDQCLQNYSWEPGENRLKVESVFSALRARDITQGLAAGLLRWLTEQGVFTSGSRTIPARPGLPAYRVEQNYCLPVYRSEPETESWLVTTQQLWEGWLAEYQRQRVQGPRSTCANWPGPLVGHRTNRRRSDPELARDANRERQSRYCQGFDPDWWLPALLAPKWRTWLYPLEATRESVDQWLQAINTLCIEFHGPHGRPERAVQLEEERENDLALIRQHAPHLLDTGSTCPQATIRNPSHQGQHPENPLLANQSPAKTKMGLDEANRKARELAKANPKFVNGSQRDWAKAIGCSVGLVARLPLWEETMKLTGRGRKDCAPVPKAISLTHELEATSGEGEREEVLEQLIAEQEADREPSPLDEDPPGSRPRNVHCHKRL